MKSYSCKNCGAVLHWNPTSSCLECEYCLKQYQPSDFEAEEKKAEEKAQQKEEQVQENTDEYVKATDESESGDLVIYKCSNCNAEVVTSKTTIATTCAFCGEALSITNKIVDDFKPDCVVPFKITKEEAMKLYKKHMKKGVLTPKDFNEKNFVEKMKGMYAPFWLHSFNNQAQAVVYCENVSSHKRGYDRVNTYKMYEVDVSASGKFENIPADALKNIDNELMDEAEPFDYSNLENFSPAYMAGFYAEECGEDAEQTFSRAEKRANDAMSSEMLESVKGYSSKKVQSFSNSCSDKTAKYTMLPIWLFHTKYKDKNYLYAVNGQTGRVAGDLPMSKKKLVKYGVISFLATQLIAMAIRIVPIFVPASTLVTVGTLFGL